MGNKGYKYYTDGTDTKMYIPGTEPEGWYRGNLSTKNATIKKQLFEKLDKEKLQTLYNNFSRKEILQQLNIEISDTSLSCLSSLIKLWDIDRSKEDFHKIESRINKIIVDEYTWTDSARQKRLNTIKNKDIEAKQNIVQKTKETKLERYGDCNYNNTDKRIQTIENKYESMECMYSLNAEKTIKTKINKYGSVYNCFIDGMIKNYGSVEEARKQSKFKEINTKRNNHTLNSSKCEDLLYENLCTIFGEDDIIRNYNSDERYPFACDFYIKSEDKFIELNAHWTHGGMPFDPEDEECQKQLQKWKEKAKTSKFYENAIDIWTRRDVQKLQLAIENNLNYEIIW